jgi:hypothetical protein
VWGLCENETGIILSVSSFNEPPSLSCALCVYRQGWTAERQGDGGSLGAANPGKAGGGASAGIAAAAAVGVLGALVATVLLVAKARAK